MTTDNFTPEQIAADRDINGKATTEQLEVYLDTCGVAGCDEHNVRGLAAGNHGMFEHKGDAEFFVNARTRFPLALDEIERLQAENAAMSEALAKAGHADDCTHNWTDGDMCDCHLKHLPDAVARGKKLLDLERRDTPVEAAKETA